LLGKEAGLFTPSGTQANLAALMAHCERGDEYIVGQLAHTYKYEGGGAAVLGSIQPQPLDFEDDGSIALEKIAAVIKPDNYHFAVTRLVCLENTQWGRVLPMEYLGSARKFTAQRGLSLHLDGARLFNAAVYHHVDAHAIATLFDSVSICLSKGLGTPVGSVLAGSTELISRARRWRKILGGGMRQAGMLAAAGIYALENNIERLAEDHENAGKLAATLAAMPGMRIKEKWLQTNMVFVEMDPAVSSALAAWLKPQGVLIHPGSLVRLVTHLDVSSSDIDYAVSMIGRFFEEGRHLKNMDGNSPDYFQ
ncbi:low-specificity L-threonine aldolase, partial [Myxococcota bacterium]|nr:low-specificity L-threonine aldolase [Myxococcota bacterium]MBU1536625.1 low-specificity L-threonine aldolase [Myxococcota bacterium]